MILFLEILDLYNEFERDMQITSYALELQDSEGNVLFSNHVVGKPMFGTDADVAHWLSLFKNVDEVKVAELFKEDLIKLNSLIGTATPIVEWGNHKYLLEELQSNNHYNIKTPYKGQFTLERAYEALTGKRAPLKDSKSRLNALKIAYDNVKGDSIK